MWSGANRKGTQSSQTVQSTNIGIFNVHNKFFNSWRLRIYLSSIRVKRTVQPRKPDALSRLARFLIVVAGIYLLVCTGCASLQRRMIYFPPKFTAQRVDEMAQRANLERWTNSSGGFIGLKRLSPKQPAAGQVLIVYGNASYAAGCAHYVDKLQTAAAFDVFILEYPGYADRSGKPSQRSLFQAADEAFQRLSTNKPVFLLGESLGSGVASYLAGTHSNAVDGLILISPFNRLTDVAQYHMPILPVHLLLIDRFPSEDYLRKYHGRVGVVVCGRDTVVPEKFGLRLYNSYAGPKRLWEFPQGEHTQIAEPPAKFWKEVVEFWQTNQISSAAQ